MGDEGLLCPEMRWGLDVLRDKAILTSSRTACTIKMCLRFLGGRCAAFADTKAAAAL